VYIYPFVYVCDYSDYNINTGVKVAIFNGHHACLSDSSLALSRSFGRELKGATVVELGCGW
jgi:hypothetical protein